MKVEEYISSGVLEMYALGMLSKAEQREVHAMLLQYPELQTELEKVESALFEYAN